MDYEKIARFIEPIHINGLKGRMLRIPGPKGSKNEILLIYGHHASLERIFGLAELLSRSGTVIVPDLPGFGGMDSFYKIGQKPSINTYADYLSAFIKLRYKRKHFRAVGFSYSVPILINTFQKYPEIAKKCDMLVSFAGFVHKEDFALRKRSILGIKLLSVIFSRQLPAWTFQTLLLHRPFIKMSYWLVADRHQKIKNADYDEQKKRIDFEATLWTINDFRTRMATAGEMFTIDLCSYSLKVPVHHIIAGNDIYFHKDVVEQHMKIIFEKYYGYQTELPNHAPSIIASAEEIKPYFPKKVLRAMAKA